MIKQGRKRGHLTIENDIADGLLEKGGIDLAGFYAALKRFIDRRESVDSKNTMPFTVGYFCKKFKIGKSRFYRLAEILWQVGMLDIDKDRSGNGWRNVYIVHDWPGYDGPLKEVRSGSFKYNKKENSEVECNSDLGQPNLENTGQARDKRSDSGIPATGIPATGIPGAECNKRKGLENTNVVVDVVEGRHVEKSRKEDSPLKEKNDNHFSFLGDIDKDETSLKNEDLKSDHCQKQERGTNKNVTEIQKEAEKIAGLQIPPGLLNRLVHEFGEEKVKEKIKMLGSVTTRNAPGFLIAALENDYTFQPGRPQQQNDRASPKRQPKVISEKDREKRELIKSLYRN